MKRTTEPTEGAMRLFRSMCKDGVWLMMDAAARIKGAKQQYRAHVRRCEKCKGGK